MRAVLAIALLSACVADVDPIDDTVDNTDGDDESFEAATAGSASALDIGFNGDTGQFGYFDDFFLSPKAIAPGPRLCHTYVSWRLGNEAPHAGDATDASTRAYLDTWLAAAQGHCDDALISLKGYVHSAAPSEADYRVSIDKLAATDWKTETGFTGQISFTPWNEPNNADDAGSGIGRKIEPRLAARYYMTLVRACRGHGCKVAAGDFASNGTMWNDYEFDCANDNVAPNELCKAKSSVNTGNKPASYLDQYKNEIANRATDYGMPAGWRPPYFAFHGWHDVNDYLNDANHCSTYDTCLIRRITKSLGGSWGGVALWDTEAGVGQFDVAPSDHDDHCTAAFLLRISTVTNRIKRLYVTRLHFGVGQLLTVDPAGVRTPRPALTVLARRETSGAGCD